MNPLQQICDDIGISVSKVITKKVDYNTKKLIVRTLGLQGYDEKEIGFYVDMGLPSVRHELKKIRKYIPAKKRNIIIDVSDNSLKNYRNFYRVVNTINGSVKYVQKEKYQY